MKDTKYTTPVESEISWNGFYPIFFKITRSGCIPALLGLMLSMEPAIVNAQTETEETEEPVYQLDPYEVNGYAESFVYARAKKRSAEQIYESIAAEDVGKLPDTNIADALQRITGVQVLRDDFGEGTGIAVRGTVNNRVEINGQALIGTDANERTPDFSDIAPELFDSIEVYKSPTADMTEGSLGATIRLNTRKPLGRKEPYLLSIRGQFSKTDFVDDYYPRGSVVAGYNWRDTGIGDFGFLTTISYEERVTRADWFGTLDWFEIAQGSPGVAPGAFRRHYVYDVNGDGEVDNTDTAYPDRYFMPSRLMLTAQERESKQLGWDTTLQLRPSKSWDFRLEASIADSQSIVSGTQMNFNTFGARPDTSFDPVFSENGAILYGKVTNARIFAQPQPNQNVIDRESYNVRFITTYDSLDRLKALFSAGTSKGERTFNRHNFRSRPKGSLRPSVTFDFRDKPGIPSVVLDPDYRDELNDPANYDINNWTLSTQNHNVANEAAQLDFDYLFYDNWITSIEFGTRYNSRSADRAEKNLTGFGGRVPADRISDFLYPVPFEDVGAGLPGVEAFPNYYLTTTGSTFEDFIEAFGLANNGLDPRDVQTENEDFPFDISEDNLAGYLKANFEGVLFGNISYTGNAGVRVVNTETQSDGFFRIRTSDGVSVEPRSESRSYTKTLPSVNVAFLLKENLALRTAIAGVMSRPRLEYLTTTTTLRPEDLSEDGIARGFRGNPELDPYYATQYDVSLEWYIGNGGLFAVAGFMKDIEASILSVRQIETYDIGDGPEEFLISSNINGPATKVKGLELTFQQVFTFLPAPFDGFGINANYTRTVDDKDSLDYDLDPVALEGLSEESFNIVAFYEKRGFGVRAAYNFRSEFVVTTSDSNGRPLLREDVGQLDLSAYYKVNRNLTLTISAVNVTDEISTNFNKVPERVHSIRTSGTRILTGFRYSW